MDNLQQLIEIYKKEQICIFTGAGVSFIKTKKYKTSTWWDLLNKIFNRIKSQIPEIKTKNEIEKALKKQKDAWEVADMLIKEIGDEPKFENILVDVLIKNTGGDKKYKRLPIGYLTEANTLKSVITFCSAIKYINKLPCFQPNEKIKCVITSNYDWYLEGGATQKYNAKPFIPKIEPLLQDIPGKLPVYHIHGYIPFDKTKERRVSLIMSSKSYLKAYEFNESQAPKILNKFLPDYTTLFIGFSFEDLKLKKHLKLLSSKSKTKHFFIGLKKDFTPETIKELSETNIFPIWLKKDFDEIEDLLKKIYLSGLKNKTQCIKKKKTVSVPYKNKDYWNLLTTIKK